LRQSVFDGGFEKIRSVLNQRKRFGGMVVEPEPALNRTRSLR